MMAQLLAENIFSDSSTLSLESMSNAFVASSRIRSLGFVARAVASRARWLSPPQIILTKVVQAKFVQIECQMIQSENMVANAASAEEIENLTTI